MGKKIKVRTTLVYNW